MAKKARAYNQDDLIDRRNEIREGKPRPVKTSAIGTAGWVGEKIEDGDISGGMAGNLSGTSVFDPVLCELAYRWFCPPGGLILDPFAGGSVRGIVAGMLGRHYIGIDLSARQIAANRDQAHKICPDETRPEWIVGDSREIERLTAGAAADMIFSCPPYMDLEVYSEDAADLSTMAPDEFRAAHADIIAAACRLLKPDCFAVWIVGEVRDKRGAYHGLVPDTIAAFRAAGLDYYNEAILVTQAGSLPIRVTKQFSSSRKIGKTHQNVLVFVKGDPRKATEAIGDCDFGEISDGAAPSLIGGEI